MSQTKLSWQIWIAALAFGIPVLAGAQDCKAPVKVEVIEKIPITVKARNCTDPANSVNSYKSDGCFLSDKYDTDDVVYKLKLYKGNEVSFLLTPQPTTDSAGKTTTPDLVLALLTSCTAGSSCLSSSADFFGPDIEEIPAVKYEEGEYYLHIDSAVGECGEYILQVKGVNPLPDLQVGLTAPDTVVAGEELTYILSVSNQGQLDADGVKVTQTLPSGVDFPRSSCDHVGGSIVCSVDHLAVGESKDWSVKLHVDGATRQPLISTADAVAKQGDPTPNHTEFKTAVKTDTQLSFSLEAPSAVVAGRSLTYILTAMNNGNSDALNVTMTPMLPQEVTIASASLGCDKETAVCKFKKLDAKGSLSATIVLDVSPSAQGPLIGNATVDSDEILPVNSNEASTDIVRRTNLILTNQESVATVNAGDPLVYKFKIENKGPSKSTGSSLRDTLPPELVFKASNACTEDKNVVTCSIRSLDPGESETVTINTDVKSSAEAIILHNSAFVSPNEEDVNLKNNSSEKVDTTITINADLELTGVGPTPMSAENGDGNPQVCAGTNLLYKFTVLNNGPSDSRGGTISGISIPGLVFVSSPDGCIADGTTVSCRVPGLQPDQHYDVRFVAVSNESLVLTPVSAMVADNKVNDPQPGNNDAHLDSLSIESASDLQVTLAGPYLAKPSSEFTYILNVANHGPSEAESVEINLVIAPAPETLGVNGCDGSCTQLPCICSIEADETQTITVSFAAPATPEAVFNLSASAKAADCDPPDNNTATASTRVVEDDSDRALSLRADRDVAVEGDPLEYTVEVMNDGFPDDEVEIRLELPGGVIAKPNSACEPVEADKPLSLKCNIKPGTPLVVEVTVSPDAGAMLESSASLVVHDSNTSNDSRLNALKVIRVAPLVLPFFEVDKEEFHLNTLLAVHNPSSKKVDFQYRAVIENKPPIQSDPISLGGHTIETLDLFSFDRLKGQTGYVGITPSGPGSSRHSLTGDFILSDPSQGSASGERLISTDTARTSPGLCSGWSTRFSQDLLAGNGTDFLFFVPGNDASSSSPVVTGRVYSSQGIFVEEIPIHHGEEAFRVTPSLLASTGSIEWTFRSGLVGHVISVHKTKDEDDVAIPGFCRSAAQPGAQTLILPFVQTSSAVNTYVAIRNETDSNAHLKVTFPGGAEAPYPIAAHAVRTALLEDVTGALKIEAFKSADEKEPVKALSGDFMRVGPGGLAGSALIDSSTQLCQTWDVRFVQGVARSETRFLVYRQEKGSLTLTAHKENGDTLPVTPPSTDAQSFLVSASDLGLSDNSSGSIEWNLGVPGYVAMLLSGEGGQSVLIPGACLPEEETPED